MMSKKYTAYSDKELVELLETKEKEAAFKELYHRYSAQVHAYCLRVLNNQELAEDIFQETFIRFFKKININRGKTNVPGFLITIARNLCLNYKRDVRPTVSMEGMDFPLNQDMSYEKKELLDLINNALELIEFEYREAFILREYDGMPYKEIAEITGITIGNAKSRVFRAKKKIKEILAPYLKELTEKK
jgi:RNA polymerase sigma-70 factor (ECF subfamily)